MIPAKYSIFSLRIARMDKLPCNAGVSDKGRPKKNYPLFRPASAEKEKHPEARNSGQRREKPDH